MVVGSAGTAVVAALQGEIRSERSQLNDWVTCVSATTPKGQAEIQSLSSRISAAQEHIERIEATHANTQASPSTALNPAGVRAQLSAHSRDSHASLSGVTSPRGTARIDTWA